MVALNKKGVPPSVALLFWMLQQFKLTDGAASDDIIANRNKTNQIN